MVKIVQNYKQENGQWKEQEETYPYHVFVNKAFSFPKLGEPFSLCG